MKHLQPFRNAEIVRRLAQEIRAVGLDRPARFMEVCGGHTAAIYRHALHDLLPDEIRLISGPGCPVCVTGTEFIDRAVKLAQQPGITIATFGDLVRVPGSNRSLSDVRAVGGDVRVFYSSADALDWARTHPERTVIFLGIGFETTACTLAATMAECVRDGIKNFHFLSALKTMPQVLRTLLSDSRTAIDGFILPGHVSAVTGSEIFKFMAQEFAKPGVVSGFEPSDLLETILILARQIQTGRPQIENQYRRVVQPFGNRHAQAMIEELFVPCEMFWRGFGAIPRSGLRLRAQYAAWDAENIPVELDRVRENPRCRCGEVLRGILPPADCPLFASVCTPAKPQGACMVSSEGACSAVYQFSGDGHE